METTRQELVQSEMLPSLAVMLFLGLFSFLLSIARLLWTGKITFLFLNWNLFLAVISWSMTAAMCVYPELRRRWALFLPLSALWFIFFPNAPYILTDLFHLRQRTGVPLWFDLILLLSFAWTGLMFGFLSLMDFERILQERFPILRARKLVPALAGLFLFANASGIYLGRFLRWNSWDLIDEPTTVIGDLILHATGPEGNPDFFLMTLLMGLLLNGMYFSFRCLRRPKL